MHDIAGSNKPSHSKVASTTGSAVHNLLASSLPRTPSLGTNIARSCSNSPSSHSSQITDLKLPNGSGNECGKDNKSICQDDSKTNEEDRNDYKDEAPEGEGEDIDTESSKESSSDTGESSSQSSHCSSETDGEIQAYAVSPAKETLGDAPAKRDKEDALKSLCLPSQSDANDKDSEKEQKCQCRKDTQLLEKNFSVWHAHMIGKVCTDWEKCDTMTCDHGDPCKELKYRDPTSPPLDYMKHCGVFKAKKSKEYDLCHFYHIELSGDLPTFPSLH